MPGAFWAQCIDLGWKGLKLGLKGAKEKCAPTDSPETKNKLQKFGNAKKRERGGGGGMPEKRKKRKKGRRFSIQKQSSGQIVRSWSVTQPGVYLPLEKWLTKNADD